MMNTLSLTLPYPPSVNTYWGFKGHQRFLTTKARQFKAAVAHEVSLTSMRFGSSRLELIIALYAPDKRIRDIDNILKPLLDSLVQAGLFDDDSQVDMLTIIRKQPIKGGKTIVVVKSY
jgi:crossover junction endodeoxyribonuclease RusA